MKSSIQYILCIFIIYLSSSNFLCSYENNIIFFINKTDYQKIKICIIFPNERIILSPQIWLSAITIFQWFFCQYYHSKKYSNKDISKMISEIYQVVFIKISYADADSPNDNLRLLIQSWNWLNHFTKTRILLSKNLWF